MGARNRRADESKGSGADDSFLYRHPEPIIKKNRAAGKGSMNDDKDSLLPSSSSSCSSSTSTDEE